jgi:FxLD family lantipeptide
MDETDLSTFALDISLVDAGPAATGYATNTDDDCGSGNTGSDACTTKCDGGY